MKTGYPVFDMMNALINLNLSKRKMKGVQVSIVKRTSLSVAENDPFLSSCAEYA